MDFTTNPCACPFLLFTSRLLAIIVNQLSRLMRFTVSRVGRHSGGYVTIASRRGIRGRTTKHRDHHRYESTEHDSFSEWGHWSCSLSLTLPKTGGYCWKYESHNRWGFRSIFPMGFLWMVHSRVVQFSTACCLWRRSSFNKSQSIPLTQKDVAVAPVFGVHFDVYLVVV